MHEFRPTDDPSTAPAVPGFRLLHLIGRGAFGQVWLADENLTGVRRAIKLLPKMVAGQYDPARELAGIRQYQKKSRNHPSLIQIYHADETDGFYYYVMELADPEDGAAGSQSDGPPPAVEGDAASSPAADATPYQPKTLASLIMQEAPLPAARALEIIADILRGLEYLHTNGLIHRDVKPSNILFVDGRAKLADVGLVTNADRDVTQVGTPGYMPPDATLDRTADLYAVGVILYEMITGLHRSRFPELPVLSPRTGRERRLLRAAIHISNRAAQPDRRRRYATAAALLRDVATGRARGSRRRLRLLAAACVLMAAAIGLPALRRPPACVSARVDMNDNHVLILEYANGNGRRIAFPTRVMSACIVDFDGDGHSLVAVGMGRSGPLQGDLVIFDPARPNSAIDAPLYKENLYKTPPWHHQEFARPCQVNVLMAGDLDGKPGQELVVQVNHDECPTHLIVFSGVGVELSEHWHYGHMGGLIAAADLTGDGLPELVCAGIANERDESIPPGAVSETLHEAVMVIDPRSSGRRSWSMNPWMNDEAEAFLAYGYFKAFPDQPHLGYPSYCASSIVLKVGSSLPIRIGTVNGLLCEFNAQLELLRIRPANAAQFPKQPPPEADNIWVRMWPLAQKQRQTGEPPPNRGMVTSPVGPDRRGG